MTRSHHPLVKGAAYGVLALLMVALGVWPPAVALVIGSAAFTTDGLLTSLVLGWRADLAASRWVGFLISLGSLLAGKSLAVFLGLAA
ncbi:MAG: hypothetical protein HY689_14800 [Chloroflexi bacterium]|nr:hypothetical protein [Chloroflexota bacterium]